MMKPKNNSQKYFNTGSIAIAQTVAACQAGVVSAYPITPQTHIVEELSRLKNAGEADFEFVQADSETAAASMVLGASAAGERAYTATSSQGLLHMLETLYNGAGLGLPFVLTLANRALSAPINIWNDHSDAMAMRDAGLIMLFAENIQEAIEQHVIAFKLSEELNLPVAVNVDGFLLTHSTSSYRLPNPAAVAKFLGQRQGALLDVDHPQSLGHLVGPADFQAWRQRAHQQSLKALPLIEKFTHKYRQGPGKGLAEVDDNGLCEYYGPKQAPLVIIAMGSVCGTIKDALDELNQRRPVAALLRIKSFRPFPSDLIRHYTKNKSLAVINRAISVGGAEPLSAEVAQALYGRTEPLFSFVAGLGGKDLTSSQIKQLIKLAKGKNRGPYFI